MNIRNISYFVLLISLLTLVFSGCVAEQASDNVSEQDSVDVDAIVYIEEYDFKPEYTTISPDETVMWVNNDSVAFIVKISLVGGDSFQSPTLRKDDSFTYTFQDRGTYKYELVTHPWKNSGFIIVE
jgi:plastocyanin